MDTEHGTAESRGNFLTSIFEIFFGRNTDRQKPRLKPLCKAMQKEGFLYYNYSKDHVQPNFAKLLFKVYSAVAPLREFFLSRNDDAYYRKEAVHMMLSERQKKILEDLTPEGIDRLNGTMPFSAMFEGIKKSYREFERDFEPARVARIDELYNSIMALKQFCIIDYYSILKRFAPAMAENVFISEPKFLPCDAKYVDEKLVDFIIAAKTVLAVKNIDHVLGMLGTLPDWKSPDRGLLDDALTRLSLLESKNVLNAMAKLLKHDADFSAEGAAYNQEIVKSYVAELHDGMKQKLEALYAERKSSVLNALVDKALCGAKAAAMPHYNQETSAEYERLGAEGFVHFEPVKFLNAFYDTFLVSDVRGFLDVYDVNAIVLRQEYFTELSAEYNELCAVCNEIKTTDIELDEKFSRGHKLKSIAEMARKSMASRSALETIIATINDDFAALVGRALEAMQTINKKFKDLSLDESKNRNEIVDNWLEVNAALDKPAHEVLNAMTSRMDGMSELLRVTI